jgi:FG-GAP repeat
MGDNFHKSSMVREIQNLCRSLGFDEVQTRLIIDKLRSELSQELEESNEEKIRLTISERLAHIIATMETEEIVPSELHQRRYNNYYRRIVDVMVGVGSAAIWDFLKFVFTETVDDSDSKSSSGRGDAAIPKGEPDRHIGNSDQGAQTLFAQQGPKLVAASAIGRVPRQGRTISRPNQGYSVSLSTDGNTAVIGGPNDAGFGAIWVFTRSARAWTRQAKLVGTGALVGRYGPGQGYSVALSGDGRTAAVGGPHDNPVLGSNSARGAGAAWVFTRSGGMWTQQAKLVGADALGQAAQGTSVSLSSDGSTLIVGGPGDNNFAGAAWVFTRSGGGWTQQAKLVEAGAIDLAHHGFSVALSGDGNTAIVGAIADGIEHQSTVRTGAAYVYACSNGVWTQQARLIARGSWRFKQGGSVSLSADGNTAIVGECGGDFSAGATWVFTRSDGVWIQQAKLVGTGVIRIAAQGHSVSLSSDGNTVITGGSLDNDGVGAAWVFTRSGSVWTQQPKLVGAGVVGRANQGFSVALSGDGNTALVGGPFDNDGVGAAWVFAVRNR